MFIVHHNMLGQALNEFSSLCDEEPAEAVVAVLNIWNLMYNKLSTVSPISSASIRILANRASDLVHTHFLTQTKSVILCNLHICVLYKQIAMPT